MVKLTIQDSSSELNYNILITNSRPFVKRRIDLSFGQPYPHVHTPDYNLITYK